MSFKARFKTGLFDKNQEIIFLILVKNTITVQNAICSPLLESAYTSLRYVLKLNQ